MTQINSYSNWSNILHTENIKDAVFFWHHTECLVGPSSLVLNPRYTEEHKLNFVMVINTDKNCFNLFHDHVDRSMQTCAMEPMEAY